MHSTTPSPYTYTYVYTTSIIVVLTLSLYCIILYKYRYTLVKKNIHSCTYVFCVVHRCLRSYAFRTQINSFLKNR